MQYAGGKMLPAQLQACGDGATLTFVLDYLAKGEEAQLTVVSAACHAPEFQAQDLASEGRVALIADGAEYTAYRYNIGFGKPHIGPIVNKYGENITRYDFEAKEHPHHRSIWFSHGSVKVENAETGFVSDEVDTWNENPHYGYIRTQKIAQTVSGDVYCAFTAENTWTDENGNPLCDDVTTVTMYQPEDGITCLDVDLTLIAAYGKVTLGATKEAGPIAVRMDETLRADKTGVLTNAWGAVGESEIWMKRSDWNDYYGVTEGGHTAGVAVFDNEANAKYPTYWHSRNYGLFAPNRYYLGGEEIIDAGEKLNFKYRIVIHEGDTAAAGIREKFIDYAAPAAVEIAE
ncbi:MAG: PmoA family protein [Clostridia bacterium]|nr:PmoA family protein [Clostridia bacterium]